MNAPPNTVSRYRPAVADWRYRGAALTSLAAIHAAALIWLLAVLAGAAGQRGNMNRDGPGRQKVFALEAALSNDGAPRPGGGKAPTLWSRVAREQAVKPDAGIGKLPVPGSDHLSDELAGVLADDPLSDGGISSYELILRKHIAEYSRGMGARLQRSGLALVRFRVARDGSIIDAQVKDSPDAAVGELALAALWRAEPLPRVPAELSAPIEVDVPIDFQVRG